MEETTETTSSSSVQPQASLEAFEMKERRAPNFTQQDCVLLCEVMGSPCHLDEKMTNYAYLKQRFRSNVTSLTKKLVWKEVAVSYNASSIVPRKSTDLDKKWNNMILVHKNHYQDYKRKISQTGNSTSVPQLSLLTIAVIDVIGPGPSLDGIFSGGDSTLLGTQGYDQVREILSMSGRIETGDQQNHKAQKRTQEDIEENCDVFQAGNGKRKQSETVAESRQSPRHAGATAARDRHSCICRCELRQEVEKLKAEKYRLEIQLLKRTLDSDIGDSGTGEE